jgi:hypothetical protein
MPEVSGRFVPNQILPVDEQQQRRMQRRLLMIKLQRKQMMYPIIPNKLPAVWSIDAGKKMDEHYIFARYKDSNGVHYVVCRGTGKSFDDTADNAHTLYNEHMKGIDKDEWQEECGTSLQHVLDRFEQSYPQGMKLSRDPDVWTKSSSRVTALGFEETPAVPTPVTMPNGQVGYICVGKCHEFFSCVEANCPEGFICRSCKG